MDHDNLPSQDDDNAKQQCDNDDDDENKDDDDTNDHDKVQINDDNTAREELNKLLINGDIASSMSTQLEGRLDNLSSDDDCGAGVEVVTRPVLKLAIPGTADGEPVPRPRELMSDGEEMRECRPGFQDLKNCKRFWQAQQLIGTRKDEGGRGGGGGGAGTWQADPYTYTPHSSRPTKPHSLLPYLNSVHMTQIANSQQLTNQVAYEHMDNIAVNQLVF